MVPELDVEKIGSLKEEWLTLEKQIGFRPTIDLKSVPLDTIRQNTRIGAAATDAKYPPPVIPGLVTEDKQVATVDKKTITVRIYTSDELKGKKAPVCIFYHGGGFVLGDIDREDALCKAICSKAHSIVANVGYRHAPEFPYPMPVEDAYKAALWVFDHIKEIGGDPDLVYTAGNSAGANLATVVTRRLRDSKRKERIAAEVLRVPVVCHPSVFPPPLGQPDSSYSFYHDAPILSTKVMDDFWYFYNPGDKASDLDCSPLLATEFKDFPPTYVSVAGCDPLRDQGWAYAKKLEEAGVTLKFDIMGGYPHGHNMWPQLPTGWKEAMDMFIDGTNWAIEQAKLRNSKPES